MSKKIFSAMLVMAMLLTSIPVFADSLMDENVARMAKLCNTPDFEVYYEAPAEGRFYTGAKFEPKSGVYHGTPHDVAYDGITNAVDTEYFWFDSTMTNDAVERTEPEPAEKTGKLALYNWNCALGDKTIDPADYENYIKNTIDDIAASGNDCMLVFAKEFNIDENFTHPENFCELFRYVADYAHTKDNIAVVWPPNNVGSVNIRLSDYYPGDEYVDWVGISLYVMPLFQGKKELTTWSNSVSFVAGDYSNAVIGAKAMTEFMEQNNIKKPIVITEGGVGFGEMPGRDGYVDGFEYVDWAAQQLRRFYYELPRACPEIKVNISFNQNVDNDFYRYTMSDSPELFSILKDAVSKPPYMTEYPSSSPVEYPEMSDLEFSTDLTLSAYAYEPKALYLNVEYLVDGEKLYESAYPPYSFTLGSTNLTPGTHTLTVRKTASGSVLDTKKYTINYAPQSITVNLNGEELKFDTQPIIENGRTLVPMRAIFEAVGATVTWDEGTETAVAIRGDDVISLTIDSSEMFRNNESITLDAPARLVGDRTLVPLRAVTEAFGAAVDWDETTRTVDIAISE